MFPSKFLQFPSILTHFHAANEKIQNGGRDLAISRGLVWVSIYTSRNLLFLGSCCYISYVKSFVAIWEYDHDVKTFFRITGGDSGDDLFVLQLLNMLLVD